MRVTIIKGKEMIVERNKETGEIIRTYEAPTNWSFSDIFASIICLFMFVLMIGVVIATISFVKTIISFIISVVTFVVSLVVSNIVPIFTVLFVAYIAFVLYNLLKETK